jgi:hypothetical protein
VADPFGPERRRTPRVTSRGRLQVRLGRRLRVRIVDISASGALLASDEPLPAGSTGRLQVLLGGGQFEGEVGVKREQTTPDGRVLLGTTLTPAQPRHQEALETFLRRAGT